MDDQHRTNWTVAWICCFLSFLHLGVARLSGLLFVAVMDHFKVSRSEASLPFVLSYTIRNLSGPLVGYLGRRWGYHKVCVTGCIITTIGLGLCFFAESVIFITIMWGGIFGFGYGLSTILIPVVIRQHFSKDIAKANGVAFGGECLAGFVLPMLFDMSLRNYGTQGTFLILSGLILNSLPAVLFLNYQKPNMKKKFGDSACQYDSCAKDEDIAFIKNLAIDGDSKLHQNKLISVSNDLKNSTNIIQHSLIDTKYDSNCENSYQNDECLSDNKCFSALASNDPSCSVISHEQSCMEIAKVKKNFQSESDKRSALKSFTVFLDWTFILILLSQSLYLFIVTTVLTIVVDFSQDIDVDSSEQIYIVMGMSVADLIGRFALGIVTDSNFMTLTTFTASGFFVMGILSLVSVWIRGFLLLMVVMLPFALLLGGLLIVFPGIVLENIEEDKITMALASRMSLYGILGLTQSQMIGFFRGQMNSYDGVFYTMFVLCFACSVLTVLTPLAAKRRNKKKKLLKESNPILNSRITF